MAFWLFVNFQRYYVTSQWIKICKWNFHSRKSTYQKFYYKYYNKAHCWFDIFNIFLKHGIEHSWTPCIWHWVRKSRVTKWRHSCSCLSYFFQIWLSHAKLCVLCSLAPSGQEVFFFSSLSLSFCFCFFVLFFFLFFEIFQLFVGALILWGIVDKQFEISIANHTF